MTDGSAKIFRCKAGISPDGSKFSFSCDQGQTVSVKGAKVDSLNELEFKDGKLFINRYMTDSIYVLNAKTLKVSKVYDMGYLKSIAQKRLKSQKLPALGYAEVLNGISWDATNQCWMLTGKKWPVVFCLRWLS